jgi:hypothetical protein
MLVDASQEDTLISVSLTAGLYPEQRRICMGDHGKKL